MKVQTKWASIMILTGIVLTLTLASCGGGGGTTYTVGGTYSLASGLEVALQNNGTDNLTLSGTGGIESFTFAAPLANGSAYNVTVLTPPAGETCDVERGSGVIAGANVTDVHVVCFVPMLPL